MEMEHPPICRWFSHHIVHLVPGLPSHVWLLSWVICLAPNPWALAGKPWFSWHWCIGGFFLRPLHAVRFHVLLKDQIRWQYFVSHVRVWKGVADGSRPCSAWSSTAASTTIWWKWHGCRFRRFVIPWQGVFFFIPGFGAQNHRQDDLVVSFLFVVATENGFCSGRDSGFLRWKFEWQW